VASSLLRVALSAGALVLSLLAALPDAAAQTSTQTTAQTTTTLRVWHTLQGAHQAAFEQLVAQFNRETPGIRVSLQGYGDVAALRQAVALGAAKERSPRVPDLLPHLLQLPDNHTPEVIAEHKHILPLYRLLAAHPIPDAAWFLPQTANFVRDARGRLLALPFMAEVPVMFVNRDAYAKAGLGLARPPLARTWADLQTELMRLRASGTLCPLLTSEQTSVHFENLAAVNGKPYVRPNNGLTTSRATLPLATLHMRHVSLMVSWQRAALLTHYSPGAQASVRFAQGDCGVLMAASGALAELRQNPVLNVAVAPLPYYAQEAASSAAPFVSGSALWALAGHRRAEDAATAAFLAWLAKPVVAARWHQQTGFLPLTHAAFRAANVSFYQRLPGAHQVIDTLRAVPATSRGFRLANYPAVAAILNQSFEDAMAGKKPPVQALNDARAGIAAIKP